MSLYLDTSILVTALTNEPETGRIQQWLGSRSATLMISDWVVTEFSSALSIKYRTGQLDDRLRRLAQDAFNRLRTLSLETLPVHTEHFHLAARLVDQDEIALRGADALHAAVAHSAGMTLCTRDKRLAEACSTYGITSQLL